MDAGSAVRSITVSRDGKVIVSGTDSGQVTVWNVERHSKVTEFKAHRNWVRAVDVSSDATKIVTGSDDRTACVWSLSTGAGLVGPLKHIHRVLAAKFSPDGQLIATATRNPSPFGSTIVGMAASSSSSQPKSTRWTMDDGEPVHRLGK